MVAPLTRHLWLWLIVTCLALPASLSGQKATAELVGTVRDPTGAVLVGTVVKLIEIDTGLTRSVSTNNDGTYVLSGVPAGRYTLEAQLAGFKRKRTEGIVLQVNHRTRIDIAMEIGEISQTLDVQGAAPVVDTESPTIGSVTTEKAIQQLPLNGRDFTQLIGLAPGVAAGTTIGVGIPKAANRINLDGGNDIEPFTGLTSITPVLDTLQEFKVQVGQYSAEYGLGGSVIVDAITKSGSNEIHGSLWEFHRNKALDAPPFFSATQGDEKIKPPLIRNQYGFLIGGPIHKNRTFALGAYEGLKLPGSQTFVGNLPTAAEKNGDFSNYARIFNKTIIDPFTKVPFPNNVIPSDRIDPISRNVVNALFVEPNNPGDPTRNWIQAQPDTTDQYNWSVRVDHLLTDRHSLFGRFSLQDQLRNRVGQNAIGMPLKYGDVITSYRGIHAVFGATSSFSPTIVNTLAISYNRSFSRTAVLRTPWRRLVDVWAWESRNPSAVRTPSTEVYPTFESIRQTSEERGPHSIFHPRYPLMRSGRPTSFKITSPGSKVSTLSNLVWTFSGTWLRTTTMFGREPDLKPATVAMVSPICFWEFPMLSVVDWIFQPRTISTICTMPAMFRTIGRRLPISR
jgi:hypothetical protein